MHSSGRSKQGRTARTEKAPKTRTGRPRPVAGRGLPVRDGRCRLRAVGIVPGPLASFTASYLISNIVSHNGVMARRGHRGRGRCRGSRQHEVIWVTSGCTTEADGHSTDGGRGQDDLGAPAGQPAAGRWVHPGTGGSGSEI